MNATETTKYHGSNQTFSTRLSEAENQWLQHMTRWGSDGYPLRKWSGKWFVDSAFGVGSCPIAFKTKREASQQAAAFEQMLMDRKAGRL